MSQKQEINRFREESQKLLVDMNHTEIFELWENSAKLQCHDCNAFSEVGIICCSCRRNLKYSRSPTTLQKTNCDFTSIPGFVIKKNTESHWRSTMLAKRKSCFSIASLQKDTTLQLRGLSGCRNAKHWILRLNADGPQKPLRPRPAFAVASKQCLEMQDAHLAETQQSLRRQRQDQQFDGGRNFDYCVDRKT